MYRSTNRCTHALEHANDNKEEIREGEGKKSKSLVQKQSILVISISTFLTYSLVAK